MDRPLAEHVEPGCERVKDLDSAILLALIGRTRSTVRGVAEMTGRHFSTVYYRLLVLRDQGLVTWDDGKAATLRATVKVMEPMHRKEPT